MRTILINLLIVSFLSVGSCQAYQEDRQVQHKNAPQAARLASLVENLF